MLLCSSLLFSLLLLKCFFSLWNKMGIAVSCGLCCDWGIWCDLVVLIRRLGVLFLLGLICGWTRNSSTLWFDCLVKPNSRVFEPFLATFLSKSWLPYRPYYPTCGRHISLDKRCFVHIWRRRVGGSLDFGRCTHDGQPRSVVSMCSCRWDISPNLWG